MPTPTDYALIEAASAPTFSTDGQTLFHLRGQGMNQVWSHHLPTNTQTQLTNHPERVATLRRAPNDDRLAYTIDAGGDEHHQIWLWENGQSRPLTTTLTTIHALGPWSQDGTTLTITANDRNPAHFDVLTLDPTTRTTTRLMEGTHEATLGPIHPDGRLICIQDRATPDQRPLLITPQAATPLPRPAQARYASLRWDGNALLGLTDAHAADTLALCQIDPATGAPTPEYAPETREVEAYALSSTNLLATIENDHGATILRVGPRHQDRPLVQLPAGVTSDPTWSPDGTRLAFTHTGPTRPPGLWLWQDNQATPLWEPQTNLPLRGFGLVTWPAPDQRPIPGFLALPEGPAPTPGWPAVIWVHGGPASQARPTFRADMQSLLHQGYAVLMPNVRGSAGYGRAALAADDLEKRLDSVHDLAAAHTFLAAHPHIDPARIAVMGQSYGGYMVLAAITEHPTLFKCAIDFYGIADFTTLLATTGPWRQAHRAHEYGDPIRHRALFDRISPLNHAARIKTPLLVLHGQRDPRVAITESNQLVEALTRRNHPVEYKTYPYAGHGFHRPEDKPDAWTRVATFLATHL